MSGPMANGDTRSRRRRTMMVALGFVVSGVFVYLTIGKIDFGKLFTEIAKVSLPILALSLVTKGLGFAFMTWRSQVLFKSRARIGFWKMFKSLMVAFVGNNVLPLRAGEFGRVGYLANQSDEIQPTSCLATIGLERLLDLFTLAILFFILLTSTLVALPTNGWTYLVGVILICAMTVVLAASRYPDEITGFVESCCAPLGEKVATFVVPKANRFLKGLAGLSSMRQSALVLLLSFGYWASGIASVAVWIWAFDLALPWYAPIVIMVFTSFATIIPSSPGFVGTYHFAVKKALELFGVAASTAASFAIVGHAAAMLPFTLIGILVLLRDYLNGNIVESVTLNPNAG